MDILSNLYDIKTLTDVFILKFGLFLSLLLLLPYLSVLIGSQLFSLLHLKKSQIFNNSTYFDLAKYLTELVTKKMWVRIIFGIIPFFGTAFFYSQLYSETAENLLFAFILFVAGICIMVAYKNGFSVKDFDKKGNNRLLIKGAWFGIVILLISSLILISYFEYTFAPATSKSVNLFELFFSTNTILMYLLFLAISFSLTSAILVARMNRTNVSYNFKAYLREFSTKTGILFTFIQPLFFVLNIFTIDKSALSFSFFALSMLILLLMLIVSVQFYLNFKNEKLKSTSIVFVFLLLFSFLIYNSQITSERIEKKNSIEKGQLLELFS